MKRSIRWVMGLVVLALVGWVPSVEATGTAVCTISGTITFSHSELTSPDGSWAIGPAIINCQGPYNGYERIIGPGSFAGVDVPATCP